MLCRNSQRRYLPKSLTDEVIEQKIKVQEQKSLAKGGGEPPELPTVGYAQIREAITERLGGAYDYAELQNQIKDFKLEVDLIKHEFRLQALQQPEFKDQNQARVPEFDFTLPTIDSDS